MGPAQRTKSAVSRHQSSRIIRIREAGRQRMKTKGRERPSASQTRLVHPASAWAPADRLPERADARRRRARGAPVIRRLAKTAKGWRRIGRLA